MEVNDISAVLEERCGKQFLIENEDHQILRWEYLEEDNVFVITSDQKTWRKSKHLMKDWLRRWYSGKVEIIEPKIPAKQPSQPSAKAKTPPIQLTILNPDTLSLIKDQLVENIQKIKEKPEYIPTAAAINEQVKSLIDIGKLEVMALRELS